MAAGKITLNSVRSTEPGETLWDSELKGFGCRCQKEDKVFIIKYRFGKGRTARQYLYTIGKLGSPWTPDTARDEARKVLGRVAHGENPAEDRRKDKQASSVDEAFTQFMDDGRGKRRPSTQKEYARGYDTHAKGAIGRHRIKDVNRCAFTKLESSLM